MKLTKIKKWAEQNNYQYSYNSTGDTITVTVSGEVHVITQRKSTSYKSWRGRWCGNSGGVYLDGLLRPSQAYIIEKLENK